MKFRMLTATQISGGKCGLGSFVVIYSLSQSMQIVAIQCDSMTQISQIHDPDLQFVKRHQAVGLFCTCAKSLEILGPLNGGISQSHHGEGALLEGCLLKHWIQDGIKALFHVFQKNRCSKLDAVSPNLGCTACSNEEPASKSCSMHPRKSGQAVAVESTFNELPFIPYLLSRRSRHSRIHLNRKLSKNSFG